MIEFSLLESFLIWKSANLTVIHKKGDKELVNNYPSISLLPICGKIFEKIVFNQLYLFFTSGFRSGVSTTNQSLNEIHESFNNSHCLEVTSVFLVVSKASIKYGMKALSLN